jgi:hypothetical protein
MREQVSDGRGSLGSIVFRSLDEVLRVLMEDRPAEVFGTRKSPARKHMIGHIARALGRKDLAEPMIAEADHELDAIRTRLNPIGRRRKAITK